MEHWLSQIELGEWFLDAQCCYKPRNDKERNLMHYCYEEGYNKGYERGIKRIKELKAQIEKIENICSQYVSNELAYEIKEIIEE